MRRVSLRRSPRLRGLALRLLSRRCAGEGRGSDCRRNTSRRCPLCADRPCRDQVGVQRTVRACMPVPLSRIPDRTISRSILLALHDGLGGNAGASAFFGRRRCCAGFGKAEAQRRQRPHPVFLHSGKNKRRFAHSTFSDKCTGEMVAVQSLQPPGCGNGNGYSAEALQAPGHRVRVAQLHPRSADQRPGYHA